MGIRRVLVALALAGIVSSFFVARGRAPAVDPPNRVEIAVDLDSARELARDASVDPEAFLRALGQAGATTLAIGPTTLGLLVREGRVAVLGGPEAAALWGPGDAGLGMAGAAGAPGGVGPGRTLVLSPDRPTADGLAARLAALGYATGRPFAVARGWAVAVDADRELLPAATLGFDPAWDAMAHRLGMTGMLTLGQPDRVVPDSAAQLLEGLRQASHPGMALLSAGEKDPKAGPTVGAAYREWFSQVGRALPEGWRLVALEGWLGEPELARALGDPGGGSREWVRGHVVELREPVADLVDAARDRGIRLFYLRPFGRQGNGWERLQPGLDVVRGLSSALAEAGYRMGPAGGPGRFAPPWWALVLAALGVAGGVGWLLLELGLSRRVVWALAAPTLVVAAACGLGAAGAVAGAPAAAGGVAASGAAFGLTSASWFGVGSWAREAMALLAACVFPALGPVWLWRWVKERPKERPEEHPGERPEERPEERPASGRPSPWPALLRALEALALASAASLAGGLLINALLGDASYAIGLKGFRGVKLAYLVPLALVAAGAWRRRAAAAPGEGRAGGAREFWWRRVAVLDLVWLLIVGGLLYVYVSRSGQTGAAPVSALELKARHWLEAVFWARPRTKEFLFGHPALVLGFWLLGLPAAVRAGGAGGAPGAPGAAWRSDGPARWAWLAVVAGAVGQASLINCFAHLHAPFVRSVLRAVAGVALGAAVGALLVVVVWAVVRAWSRRRRRPDGKGGA